MKLATAFCPHCNGRGFHWATGKIVSRRDGQEIATTYRDGGKCENCNGTGEVGLYLATRRVSQILIAIIVVYMAWQFWRVM